MRTPLKASKRSEAWRGMRWLGVAGRPALGLLATVLLGSSVALAQNRLPNAATVVEAMRRANNYWISNNAVGNAGWANAAYYTGNQRACRVLGDATYLNRALSWANANQWHVGPESGGTSDANSQCCGQTYVDLYRMDPQPSRVADLKQKVNAIVASPNVDQWWWCDAFYMAPASFARLANLYGDTNYVQKMFLMYNDMKVRENLFDEADGLWFRDASYIYPAAKTSGGKKVFWARGNGWVIAGLARVLEELPANAPQRAEFVSMFQTMAAALKPLQGADGMWRSSLLEPSQFPNPETSGSGFFTFALAWGVRHGLLSAEDYTNTIANAWNGLTNLTLAASGRVGYVQPTGPEPAAASATDTAPYGVGAFLLACSEILLLAPDGPAVSPWAGPDETVIDQDQNGWQSVTLDGSATEVYRGPALSYTWWTNGVQAATGITAEVVLPLGSHLVTLRVVGADGVAYTDSVVKTVSDASPANEFVLFEDFEHLTLGGINGQNGWTATAGSNVALDPANPSNQVLAATTNNNIFRSLTIPNGSTATVFARFRFTTVGGITDLSFGLSDTDNPTPNDFPDFEVQVNRTNSLRMRDAGSFSGNITNSTFSSFTADTWYNLWLVIDNSDAANSQGDDTTAVYVNATPQADASANDRCRVGTLTEFRFRNGTAANDLKNFFVRMGQDHADGILYLDDIYVDWSGANLANPLAGPALPADAYRSVASGDWSNPAIWQRLDGSNWVAAIAPPERAAGVITIRSNHTVTVTTSVDVDQVVVQATGQLAVNSGATLSVENGSGTDLEVYGTLRNAGAVSPISGASIVFQSGGKYQHNFTTTEGVIPTATWAVGSTCEIIGYTSNVATSSAGGWGQNFYDFAWNCPNQTTFVRLGAFLTNVLGNFTVQAGTVYLTSTTALPGMNVWGNFIQTGGTFRLSGTSAVAAMTVHGSVVIAGGSFDLSGGTGSGTLNVEGDLTVSGSGALTETGTGVAQVFFNGAGVQNFTNSGAINNTIHFTVNNGATLLLGTNRLTGSGNFTNSAGATLGLGDPNGITTSGASGNIGCTGTRSFNAGASYSYTGSAPQVTGNALPTTVNNLAIANPAGVTLSGPVRVTGSLTLTSGKLVTGANLFSLATSATLRGGGGSQYIVGALKKSFSAGSGQTFSFPIGDATRYAPVSLATLNVLTTGDLTATTTGTAHPNFATSGLNPAQSANRYWTLVAGSGLTVSSYSATFTFAANDVDSGADPLKFVLRKYDGAWAATTLSDRQATCLQASGLSGFGDFAAGAQDIAHYVVSVASPQAAGVPFYTTVLAQDALNQSVLDDSTTVVTLTGTGSVQFDGNGDGTFGDNTKALTGGVLNINTRDTVAQTINITATDANSKTGTRTGVVIQPGGNPVLVLDSTTLVSEGFVPANNGIDPSEPVTVAFTLKNTGVGNTANLVATLLAGNGVTFPSGPQSYGVLAAGGPAVTQSFAFVATGSCGGLILPTLQLQDGAVNWGTVSASLLLGQSGTVLTQDFDSVTIPALPAGWTSSATGAQSPWITTNTSPQSAPNAAFSRAAANSGVNELVSPPIALVAGQARLSFRNSYDLEWDGGSVGWDGGVLEIKIGAGAFTDILAAGGSFVGGGYNCTIDNHYGNPLGSRQGWSGNSGGYLTTVVNLPATASGQTIQLRWRCGTDSGVGTSGWRIDSVGISGWACVFNSNSAPQVANPIPNQAGSYGLAFSFQFPSNTFVDPNQNALTYSASGLPPGITFSGATRSFSGTPTALGAFRVQVIAQDNGSPSLSATNAFTLSVGPATVQPVVSVADKVYDGTSAATIGGRSLTGLIDSDIVTLTGGTASFVNASAGASKPVAITGLSLGGADAAKYQLSSSAASASATIWPKALQVTAEDKTKVYGQPDPPFTIGCAGFVAGENETALSGALVFSRQPGEQAGQYTITPAGLTAGNYAISFAPGKLSIVEVRPQILSVTSPGPTNTVITWSTVSNVTYRVQHCPALESGGWSALAPDVRATNSTATLRDNTAGVAARFYRILVLEP